MAKKDKSKKTVSYEEVVAFSAKYIAEEHEMMAEARDMLDRGHIVESLAMEARAKDVGMVGIGASYLAVEVMGVDSDKVIADVHAAMGDGDEGR